MSAPILDPITRRVQLVLISNAAEVHGAHVYEGPICLTCGFQSPETDPDCGGRCEENGRT